jgi:hypothetical protein
MTKADDEIAALRARADELERAAKPPEPLVSDWTPPPNPIDRLCMSPQVVRDMAAAVPDRDIKDIVARGGIQGPTGMAPTTSQVGRVSTSPGILGSGTGWAREIPLGPSPHQRYVDQQIDAQDMKDRQELIEKKAREQAAMKLAENSK